MPEKTKLRCVTCIAVLLMQDSKSAGVIARRNLFGAVPVISKDLLEDAPVPRMFDHHRNAPSSGMRRLTVTSFYHVSRSGSIPSIGGHRHAFTHLLALE